MEEDCRQAEQTTNSLIAELSKLHGLLHRPMPQYRFNSFGQITFTAPTSTSYQPPSSAFQPPSSAFQPPSSTYQQPPSSAYQTPSSTYQTSSSAFQTPSSAAYQSPSSSYQSPAYPPSNYGFNTRGLSTLRCHLTFEKKNTPLSHCRLFHSLSFMRLPSIELIDVLMTSPLHERSEHNHLYDPCHSHNVLSVHAFSIYFTDKCPLCQASYPNKDFVELHFYAEHSLEDVVNGKSTCPVCQDHLDNKALIMHVCASLSIQEFMYAFS